MNRTLLSLAILKTNWDAYRKDYIENFIPFIATLISNKKYAGSMKSNCPKTLNLNLV
jgi:hypothetical protein